MPIAVVCPSCSARLNAPDAAAGKQVKCPKCKNAMIIPEPMAEAADFDVVDETPLPKPPKPKPPARVKADVVVDDDEDRPRKKPKKAVQVDEDDDRPKKKKKKQAADNNSLIRNVVGGVVLVALLGVAGYVFYDRYQQNKKTDDANTAAGGGEVRGGEPKIVGGTGGPGVQPAQPGVPGQGQPDGPPGKGKTIGVPGQPITLTSPSGFKVTFPGPYAIEDARPRIRDAIGLPVRLYVSEDRATQMLYVAAAVELPAAATETERKQAYEKVVKTLIEEGGKVKVQSRKSVMFGGRTWEEIKISESANDVAITRLLQTDSSVFLLLAASEAKPLSEDAAKKYFESFELTK